MEKMFVIFVSDFIGTKLPAEFCFNILKKKRHVTKLIVKQLK